MKKILILIFFVNVLSSCLQESVYKRGHYDNYDFINYENYLGGIDLIYQNKWMLYSSYCHSTNDRRDFYSQVYFEYFDPIKWYNNDKYEAIINNVNINNYTIQQLHAQFNMWAVVIGYPYFLNKDNVDKACEDYLEDRLMGVYYCKAGNNKWELIETTKDEDRIKEIIEKETIRLDNIIKTKEKEAEVRYDQLRDSLQKLNTQIPEKWQGVYSYLVSDEGLTVGGSSTSVWETFTVKQDSIISERQGYMADFIDNYLPAIKYPDTLYMYLDRCLNRDGKPKYYSSSLKPDVLYKKGDTFYLNDRKLDYRPLNE